MADRAGAISGIAAGRARAALGEWVMRALSLSWLTGPIFDKELRVSSRRRRNYVLRVVYVASFMIVLALVWLNFIVHRSSAVYEASRMAQAGLTIVGVVVWFQFLMAQAVAIVMLSTSISDEIYHRTLGVLMTTPIGSAQIVLGKLLSKLLQLLLLMAITLPLLGIVRVFGGVPWDYLACGLCVTVTTVVFVASLSLLFSIFTRRAYVVIIVVVLTMGLLFALLPLIAALLLRHVIASGQGFFNALQYVNPYAVMMWSTESLASARTMVVLHWQAHCVVSLGVSSFLMFLATVLVRRAALRQALGQSGLWSISYDGASPVVRTRRVVGPPVLWKERRTPLLGRRRLGMTITVLLSLGLLIITYVLCLDAHILTDAETHVVYVIILLLLGMLFATVLPATCVTSEKESGTWPLLLTTTVSNWGILWGKLLGAVRRSLPAWFFLFGHVVLFMLLGQIHPVGVAQLAILVAWVAVFLSGTGLYFSTRFKHTTTAVIANVALAAGLWAVFPLLLAITLAILSVGSDVIEVYMDINPVVHAIVITMATARNGSVANYEWLQGGITGPADTTAWMLFNFALYAIVGLVFLMRAHARIRRNPFH
jgi:ABC-2 type transport system permease protein